MEYNVTLFGSINRFMNDYFINRLLMVSGSWLMAKGLGEDAGAGRAPSPGPGTHEPAKIDNRLVHE